MIDEANRAQLIEREPGGQVSRLAVSGVELATVPELGITVRNPMLPDGPVLAFDAATLRRWVVAVKGGAIDELVGLAHPVWCLGTEEPGRSHRSLRLPGSGADDDIRVQVWLQQALDYDAREVCLDICEDDTRRFVWGLERHQASALAEALVHFDRLRVEEGDRADGHPNWCARAEEPGRAHAVRRAVSVDGDAIGIWISLVETRPDVYGLVTVAAQLEVKADVDDHWHMCPWEPHQMPLIAHALTQAVRMAG